jgi:hypothetical protein
VTQLRWLATAAIAAIACQLAIQYATPIDRALPFLAVMVTLVAAVSYPSLMIGVPLLVLAEIAIPDEGMRLLAFGVSLAAVWSAGVSPADAGGVPRRHPDDPMRRGGSETLPASAGVDAGVPLAAILVLRWIPFSEVHVGRELFLLVIAAVIVLVLDRTPFAVAIAVVAVLITPAIPLRTLLLPIAVLFIAIMAKVFGMPKVKLVWPSTIVLAFVMMFFAWSGVVARAFPYFLQRARPEVARFTVAQALTPRASLALDVPEGAGSLIVSGANVAHLPRGTVLGAVGARTLRIGDAADWGYLRREYFYGSRNPLPRDPAGKLRGYGYAAWVDGAGRIALAPKARTIVVTADAALPPGASLQVEGFE